MATLAAVGLAVSQGSWLAGAIREAEQRVAARVSSRISDLLRLDQVTWEEVGSTNLSHLATKDALWSAAGLKQGQEMLQIDLADLEKRLLAVPWIESVQLQKKLPSTLSVRYTTHHARALGLRKGRVWALSSYGKWISPIQRPGGQQTGLNADLPLLVSEETLAVELAWLDALEKELSPHLLQIHEVNCARRSADSSCKMTAFLELRYPSQSARISLVGMAYPEEQNLIRLKRVVQYLIKNNILVSTIDLRPGKKVVVNVGRRP